MHRQHGYRRGDQRGQLREVEIRVGAAVSLIADGERTSGCDLCLRERVERGQTVVRDLIAPAHGRLAGAEPGNLPGKPDSGPEIVIVVREIALVRVWRIRAHVFERRRFLTYARVPKSIPTSSRYSENRPAASDRLWHHAEPIVNRSVVVPANTEVQRETRPDFPIILEEDAELITMRLSNTLGVRQVRFKVAQVVRVLHVVKLRDLAQ